MQKILLVLAGCVTICGFAYRFGDAKWEDAKKTGIEKMYQTVSELMFPQIHVYEYSKEMLLYKDMEEVLMPVLSSFQTSGNKTSSIEGMEKEEKQDAQISEGVYNIENVQASEIPQSEKETERADEAISQEEQIPVNSQTEEETVPTASPNPVIEKKTEINLVKLQDFDYLRQNFYQVDNTTTIGSDQLDVVKLLEKNMKISSDGESPKILIYHTHSQEGYADSQEGDMSTTVTALGAELARILSEKYGISVMHHSGQYDVPDHANAYAAALPAIQQILEENPSIEVVIDLHRDGVPADTHFVTEINGKPTAKIMFFNGLSRTTSQGDLAYLPNPYIEDNLAFSLQTQLAAAEYYPDFTRRIYLKGYRYNMHLCPKSMLVEVGAQTNTFEEAKNAMEPLADVLALVLTAE